MKNNQLTCCSHRQSGITVVEWLVVLSFVVLLVGFLLPALACTRGCGSLRVKDLSNLKQSSISMIAYSVDHEGVLPSHPRDANEYIGYDPGDISAVYLSPYQQGDEPIDRGDGDGITVRYGGYVFLNLGRNLEEIENPDELILAYTAKITPDQLVRNVAFADGHVESWEEDQLRSSLPEDIDVDALDGP